MQQTFRHPSIGKPCPTCGEEIVQYPALSRKDNLTYVCSPCGESEGMVDYFTFLAKGCQRG